MPAKLRLVPVIVNVVFVVVGLVAIVWGVAALLNPTVTCHGVEMGPGDVCHRLEIDGSDRGQQQSYEAARAQKRQGQPVVIGMGVLVAGFAGALLAQEVRRSRRAAR